MSESVTLKSYFYEVLIPSSQKNTSSPIEDILHHVSISFMKKLALYKCFNPRTHTGCDYRNAIENGASEVSIHAPTRGATSSEPPTYHLHEVSIHAPTRGATTCGYADVLRYSGFQSTHPHGVRHTVTFGGNEEILFQSTHPHGVRPFWQLFHCLNTDIVSIHAPTRGATYVMVTPFLMDVSFNPRTHTGCDQSLHTYGTQPYRFNPRTHTGCDSVQSYIL